MPVPLVWSRSASRPPDLLFRLVRRGMETAQRSRASPGARLRARPRRMRWLRPGLSDGVQADSPAARALANQGRGCLGSQRPQVALGRGPHHSGVGRRRRMRSVKHANPVSEMPSQSHRQPAKSSRARRAVILVLMMRRLSPWRPDRSDHGNWRGRIIRISGAGKRRANHDDAQHDQHHNADEIGRVSEDLKMLANVGRCKLEAGPE
jgi:hypothetical protein